MGSAIDLLTAEIDDFTDQLSDLPISPNVKPDAVRDYLRQRYDFTKAVPLEDLVRDVSRIMRQWHLQATHPRYFGLFNPSVTLASIVADALVALYNPQLAAWSHAPAANEIERFTLRYLMTFFGFDPAASHANFTTGGLEANHTAVIAALTHHFPAYGDDGLLALPSQPLIYLSEEAHHSFVKIAHMTGIGRSAIRIIPSDRTLKLDLDALATQYKADLDAGNAPFFVVGTAGTTGSGVIDPLSDLAGFCRSNGLWFHVDAAWGGAAAASPRLRPYLAGIEAANSITCDAHKWFSVTMRAGMFFCRHPDVIGRAFRIAATYMPGEIGDTVEPYATTIQWSRRFIGLKVFMTLAELGTDQFVARIELQAAMGELLRQELLAAGWEILNDTPLPVVCFNHPQLEDAAAFIDRIYADGKVWISQVLLHQQVALRACVTSFRTTPTDVTFLVNELNRTLQALE